MKTKQMMWIVVAIFGLTLAWVTACKNSPQTTTDTRAPTGALVPAEPLVPRGVTPGERPRFSPDGRFIAFHHGKEGARQLFVMNAASGEATRVADMPGDNKDPSWAPDGERLVFSSNRSGKYDLYVIKSDGSGLAQITDLPGDAVQATVSPLRYSFFVVFDDGCNPTASGRRIDAYEKVVFTRRYGDPAVEEVWFTSLKPAGVDPLHDDHYEMELSDDNSHQGRLSPEGARCGQPGYSGDGLQLAWVCDDNGTVVHDTLASWDQDFDDAVKAIGRASEECEDSYSRDFDWDTCLAELPRRYARHDARPVSEAASGLARPAYSTNHVMVLADAAGQPVYRERFDASAAWNTLNIDARDVRNVVWSPDGTHVAFDARASGSEKGRTITVAKTDFYLQEVRNLHQFPELIGQGQSDKLQQNRFVVRPGDEREFYAHYEKLRYQARPQYVTADATLQAFRDEFMRILEDAEERTAGDLVALSEALFMHYSTRFARTNDARDRYLAVYFAVPSVVLRAAVNVAVELEEEDHWPPQQNPVLPGLPEASARLVEKLPEGLRSSVAEILENAFAHQGIGELVVPSRSEPAKLDWSQFKVRGNYAENDLAGYFLAMVWYAQAPLPFDDSLAELAKAMEGVKVGDRTAFEVWTRIDAVVASFMGKPVDATVSHLMQAREAQPAIFAPFKAKEAKEALEALRGPMLIRDADSLEAGERLLKVTFLPRRVGLDTTFFRKLTYPDAGPRPFPSSLDVMAVMGSSRAYEHVTAAADGEEWAAQYRAALDRLISESETPGHEPGYWGTDIYHSWLAVLVALAAFHEVDDSSLMTFARSDAWRDRQLFSALAGYTQLKHSAVLYNAQDMSAECGGETTYFALVEQPILPPPHGFVDPMPSFFEGLAGLAGEVYSALNVGTDEPGVDWHWDHDPINARILAQELADIARQEVRGEPLTKEQLALIQFVGARFEAMTLGLVSYGPIGVLGEGRVKRGIALATDIHTNLQRAAVLQLGVGTIMSMYVAVPDGVGQTMTQGGIFSFYEFTHPMSDRLTDEKWMELLGSEDAPKLPAWTESFIEGR